MLARRPSALLLPLPLLLLFPAASRFPLPAGAEAPDATPESTAADYQVDNVHSWVLFRIRHLGVGAAWGQFRKISGSFHFDSEAPKKSAVDLVVGAASVTTGDAKRDQHLRSQDFLSVKEFPDIRFHGSGLLPQADGSFLLDGELELHGVKKAVRAKVEKIGEGPDPWGHFRAGFEARFTIHRSEFGIDYLPEALGEEVRMIVAVEGVRD